MSHRSSAVLFAIGVAVVVWVKILVRYRFQTRTYVHQRTPTPGCTRASMVYLLMNLTIEGQKRQTISSLQPYSLAAGHIIMHVKVKGKLLIIYITPSVGHHHL